MAANKINAHLNAVHWKTANLSKGQTVFVCDASKDEWNDFVESSDQAIKSTRLEWASGQILIVELRTDQHAAFSRAIDYTFSSNAALRPYFVGRGDSLVRALPRLQPDESFGPSGTMQRFGAQLTNRLARWGEYHTLKVETGRLEHGACLKDSWTGRQTSEFVSQASSTLCA